MLYRGVLLQGVLWAVLVGAGASRSVWADGLIKEDLETLCSGQHFTRATLGVVLSGLAHQWDDEVQGEVDQPMLAKLVEGADHFGSSRYTLTLGAGLWGVSRVADWPQVNGIASDVLRASLLTSLFVQPVKILVGRERPDGSDNLSFPSGHSANVFALTAVLSRRFGARVGLPLGAVTLLVPVARVHLQRHHFSDVVAGSLIGLIVGTTIKLKRPDAQSAQAAPSWRPHLGAGPGQLRLNWQVP